MSVAKRPLNPAAVEAADGKLWQDNPELSGRKLTMSPADYPYRRQWMAAYTKALAEQKIPPPTSGGVTGAAARRCPAASTADLLVRVVRANDGSAIDGARVTVAGAEGRSGVTNRAGEARFRGVCAGAYVVEATKAGFAAGKTSVVVVHGKESRAELRLAAAVGLRVEVRDEQTGAAIAGANVQLSGPAKLKAVSDTSGRAEFSGIATGRYRIDVQAAGCRPGSGAADVRDGTNTATVRLAAFAGLTGRVLDSNDDFLVFNATVTLEPVDGAAFPPAVAAGGSARSTQSDTNGMFEFGDLATGQYRVTAEKDGARTSKVVQVNAGSSTTVDLVIDSITVTSVAVTFTPKQIIHRWGEPIVFKAVVDPPPPGHLVYHWSVDGVEDWRQRGDTYSHPFEPEATVADRRKDYRVEVRVIRSSASCQVRVAQNTNVGTPNVAQSTAGLDAFGWTDSSPEAFDLALTDKEAEEIQTGYGLTRPIRRPVPEPGVGAGAGATAGDLSDPYGRLQFSATASSNDMETFGYVYRAAAIVIARSSAFQWNREEFEAMLNHERQHCRHYQRRSVADSVWKHLMDGGFATTFSPFTEMLGYYSYVQSRSVSYKFLLDYNAIDSFIREYNNARTALNSLSGDTKSQAKAFIQDCFDNAQFDELRESLAAGWDHHIDPP